MTKKLADRFAEAAKAYGVAARLQHCCGEFQIYFTDRKVRNYRDAWAADQACYKSFYEAVTAQGLWMSSGYLFHHGLTYAHGDQEIEAIIAAFRTALENVKSRML